MRLTHSQRKARRLIERMLGRPYADDLSADGSTTALRGDAGDIVIVVCVRGDLDEVRTAAIIAHEATHAAWRFLEQIGEDDPGEEEFAYVTQAIVGSLTRQHLRWLRKRQKK